ncbi:MAG TPA: DUF4861 domain-containing protein [Chryseosolibacter sp.]|nr:DUF4861 domain-containing protein [Chryseosolibacter sp.]
MKPVCLLFISSLLLHSAHAQTKQSLPRTFGVKVTNPLPADRENVLVVISPAQLKSIQGFNPKGFVVMHGDEEIPSQYNARDDRNGGIAFVIPKLAPSEKRTFTIRYDPSANVQREYKKLTQAELSHKTGGAWNNREYKGGTFVNVASLRVPPEHKDHSWFIRYEGPGWESDKVAYRFYLDQRNATDVFGKTVPDLVLQRVGHDGFDSYHNLQPWGMDVMKVGPSLGIGSIGAWVDGSVTRVEKTDSVYATIQENGALYSSVRTDYYGWKAGEKKSNTHSFISIHAGTRLTRQVIVTSTNMDNLCTGIVKDPKATKLQDAGSKNRYGYLATFGPQSLNNDNLGLAVFFKAADLSGLTEDANSHVVRLKPFQNTVEYFYAAAWEKEPDGIRDQAGFEAFLKKTAEELANPVKVEIE